MALLDKYRSSTAIRHPSWRVYRAIEEVMKSDTAPEDVKEELCPELFGLSSNIEVFYPYKNLDDVTLELMAALTHPDYEDDVFDMEACLSLFFDVTARQLMECMLMENMLPADIARDLGYSVGMVQAYKSIFFDTTVWRTSADRLAYLRKGTIGEDSRIKDMASTRGIDYVKVKIFHMPGGLRLDKAMLNLFGEVYFQAMDLIKSREGEDQKNAQEWTRDAVSLFRELKSSTRSEGGIRELTIALQTKPAPDKSLDDLEDDGVDDDY